MEWTDEVEKFWKHRTNTGFTLIFLHDEDEDPIAFQAITVDRFHDEYDIKGIIYQAHKGLVRCTDDCDRSAIFKPRKLFIFLLL
jgi:hypothetical protein